MTNFREVYDIQQSVISDLKSRGYHSISSMANLVEYDLPEYVVNFEMNITKSVNQEGVISVVVKMTDHNEPPPLPDVFKNASVNVISSSSVDGFDISPDGQITDMHDDLSYDD